MTRETTTMIQHVIRDDEFVKKLGQFDGGDSFLGIFTNQDHPYVEYEFSQELQSLSTNEIVVKLIHDNLYHIFSQFEDYPNNLHKDKDYWLTWKYQ